MYCQPLQEPAARQTGVRQLCTVHTALARDNLQVRVAERVMLIKKSPSEGKGKTEYKTRGQFFWLLYITLYSPGAVLGRERMWPQYLGIPAILGSHTSNIQPGGGIAKGTEARTIWDTPKGL